MPNVQANTEISYVCHHRLQGKLPILDRASFTMQQQESNRNSQPSTGTYQRPWKSFVEQLDLLKRRGMTVSDERSALHQLEHIGYYRLSGYWYPFRSLELTRGSGGERVGHVKTDLFEPGTQFTDAVNLYHFDKQLRLILMDALESIEIALRVDIAYRLGARDPLAHLNPAALHPSFAARFSRTTGKTAFEAWQQKYSALLKRSKEDFVKHYRTRHGGDLPVWVAIEVWDFGTVSQLLAMMKVQDQQTIAQKYSMTDWRVFQSWLRSLNYLRNLVAHHSRLWNRNIVDQPRLPALNTINWCDTFIGKSSLIAKPFLLLAIVLHMMKRVAPQSMWHQYLKQHLERFPLQHSSRKLSLADSGAPPEWEAWWSAHFSSDK